MINLLSRDEQKKVYREYLLRIATLVFVAIGVVGAVFILVLIPSYMRLESEIASVNVELEEKRKQLTPEDQSQVAEAQRFLSEVRVLQGSSDSSLTLTLIERVIALKPARVTLNGFQYDYADGVKKKFSVKGKADRREDLLEFKSRLETEGGFSGIDLPSQTLIKRTDIQFSMDLTVPATLTQPQTPSKDPEVTLPTP